MKVAGYPVAITIIGASLSEPHIDRVCQPRTCREKLCGYASIIHPRLSTLVAEIRVCHEILREFRYIDVLTCVIYN